MRSKIAQRIIDETPKEVRIFVRKYGDIVIRVNQLLREKGFTQRDLAGKLDKTPSEISKWLNGDHNFTLRSISKLEAILGEPILTVAKRQPAVFVLSVTNGSSQRLLALRGIRMPTTVPNKFYTTSPSELSIANEMMEQYN
jgi:transcriptional regulator with XRE-family HTH domain